MISSRCQSRDRVIGGQSVPYEWLRHWLSLLAIECLSPHSVPYRLRCQTNSQTAHYLHSFINAFLNQNNVLLILTSISLMFYQSYNKLVLFGFCYNFKSSCDPKPSPLSRHPVRPQVASGSQPKHCRTFDYPNRNYVLFALNFVLLAFYLALYSLQSESTQCQQWVYYLLSSPTVSPTRRTFVTNWPVMNESWIAWIRLSKTWSKKSRTFWVPPEVSHSNRWTLIVDTFDSR